MNVTALARRRARRWSVSSSSRTRPTHNARSALSSAWHRSWDDDGSRFLWSTFVYSSGHRSHWHQIGAQRPGQSVLTQWRSLTRPVSLGLRFSWSKFGAHPGTEILVIYICLRLGPPSPSDSDTNLNRCSAASLSQWHDRASLRLTQWRSLSHLRFWAWSYGHCHWLAPWRPASARLPAQPEWPGPDGEELELELQVVTELKCGPRSGWTTASSNPKLVKNVQCCKCVDDSTIQDY